MLRHHNDSVLAPERVTIMGVGGFVGGAIARHLQTAGVNVQGLTRADVDLGRAGGADTLAKLLDATDAFVAVSAVAPVKNLDMLKENLTIIETVCSALNQTPVAHVLNISSDAVYADSTGPLHEESCASPGSLHGIMHLTREIMLAEACGPTPFATLRPTLIYGSDDPHNGYGPNRFRRLAAEGQTITLFGEGEERRDHVWIEDVATLATLILQYRSEGSLNAATGNVVSFREAAETVAGLHTPQVEIHGSPRSGPMPHNGYRPFDPSATSTAFPDFGYTDFATGVARVHAATESRERFRRE